SSLRGALHLDLAAPARSFEIEDPEVAADDVDGDVVDGDLADLPPERARVRVPVHDEVGAVLGDRRGETVAPEQDVDARGLADVRQHRAGEAADESLRPDDAEAQPRDLALLPRAPEYVHARVHEHRGDLVRTAGVAVVVAEHGEHGNRPSPAGVGENLRLLRLSRRREIPG